MNKNIFRLYGRIDRDLKENPETFNTGLVGEALIVASYKQMKIDQLEKLRFIINKIIQKKKACKAADESKKEDNHEDNDIDGSGAGEPEYAGPAISDDDRQQSPSV